MKIINGNVVLEDARSFMPEDDFVRYTEQSGTQVLIPVKLLVRLYEGSRYHLSKNRDWDAFCNSLFANEPK